MWPATWELGNVAVVRKGFEKLQQLSTTGGPNLQDFLAKCSCQNVCGLGNCTLTEYDECEEIIVNDYPLQRIAPSSIKRSVLRGTLYESSESDRQSLTAKSPGVL